VHYNLENSLYLLYKIDEAIENYEQSLKLNPKKIEAYYNIGNSYCNQNDFNLAIHYCTKANSFDPGHDPAVYNIGYAFHRTGD
jgi:tetratricopeptide (TPR) repeat protein